MRARNIVLVAIGAFLLSLVPMIRLYAYPRLTELPPNYWIKTTAYGENATVFDAKTLTERHGATLTATRTFKGDPSASNGKVAVWDVFQVVEDERGTKVDIQQSRVALDRRTGRAVHCCGEKINGDTKKHYEGLTYKFPFHTGRHDYQLFDDQSARVWPAIYSGTEKVHGLTAYKFVQHIKATKVRDVGQLPGNLVGEPDKPAVAGSAFYASTRTYWVEPRTGIVVNVVDDTRSTLRGPAGRDGVTGFGGTMKLSQVDVRYLTSTAKTTKFELFLLSTLVPLLLGLIGAGLIAFALLSTARARSGSWDTGGVVSHGPPPEPAW